MVRHLPLWKRITCSLLLLVFALSAVGGTICTGHKAAHAAVPGGAWAAQTAPSDADADDEPAVSAPRHDAHHHHDHHHGHSGSPHDEGGACDAPVYIASSEQASVQEAGASPATPDLPALIDTVNAAATVSPTPPPWRVAWDRRPPPYQDLFSVTARLRL